MIIYVDIDDTICYYENDNQGDYSLALPYRHRIQKINKLYEEGNEIYYWTNRGYNSNKDEHWLLLTKKQLDNWGCKYSAIKLGKPKYDLFIDDKNINSEDYFK